MSEVFKTRNNVLGYLNSCYNYRLNPTMERDALTDNSNHSEDMYGNSLYNRWYNNGYSATNYANTDGSPWETLYQGVRKCNVFIANIETLDPSSILNYDGEIGSWLAQARTLRALYYLELFKRYGACPLLTVAYETTHNFASDVRTPVSEIVTQIVADCDAALASPEVNQGFSWKVGAGQRGVMTRAVAHFVKAQALLFAASPQFADGAHSWNDALIACSEALGACLANGYELFNATPAADVAQNAYAFYFISASDEQQAFDKEFIYPGIDLSIWQSSGLPSTSGQLAAGVCPSQELVDCYEMKATGLPPIAGYADEQHLNPIINTASGYNPDKPYDGRDPRFYATVYYNQAPRSLETTSTAGVVETFVGGADEISSTDRRNTHTGYYLRKYNNWKSNKNNSADGQIRKFRLGELYLNFAEAACQASASPYDKVALGYGLSLSAADAVNAIRRRAGMPDFPTNLSKDDFEKKYRNERRVELAFEDVYYFDVRRWKIMPETSRYVSGMRITTDGDGAFNYQRFALERFCYSDKFYLYPLNVTEVNKMTDHTNLDWQNEGW